MQRRIRRSDAIGARLGEAALGTAGDTRLIKCWGSPLRSSGKTVGRALINPFYLDITDEKSKRAHWTRLSLVRLQFSIVVWSPLNATGGIAERV